MVLTVNIFVLCSKKLVFSWWNMNHFPVCVRSEYEEPDAGGDGGRIPEVSRLPRSPEVCPLQPGGSRG